MNWAYIIFAGYTGVVVAIVLRLFKKGWLNKVSVLVIALIAIISWGLFDTRYLNPRGLGLSGQTEEQKFDAAFSALPVYPVLQEHAPQLLAQLREKAVVMRKEGKSPQQIIDAIRPDIISFQIQSLQSAPDANAVAFMQITMQQAALIQRKSDDSCFRFLFPEVKGGINPVPLLPKNVMQRSLNVEAEMVRAAYGAEKHRVTDAERQLALRAMQPITRKLYTQYGSDLFLMAKPEKAVGKEKMTCNIIQDLWREVLLLPEDRAASIIRLSMAE